MPVPNLLIYKEKTADEGYLNRYLRRFAEQIALTPAQIFFKGLIAPTLAPCVTRERICSAPLGSTKQQSDPPPAPPQA
jgi:hypothetical protein